jgi:streptogramin lyase
LVRTRAHCPHTHVALKALSCALASIRALGVAAGKSAPLTTTSKRKAKTACVGAIIVTTSCKACAALARAKRHAVVLGQGFFNIPAHKTGHIRVSLTKQGKNAIRRLSPHASLEVEITVSSVDVLGRRRARSYSSVVKR